MLFGEAKEAGAVAGRTIGAFTVELGGFPRCVFNLGEAFLGAIRVVSTGIGPEHYGCAGVVQHTGNHDLVAFARVRDFADALLDAAGDGDKTQQEQEANRAEHGQRYGVPGVVWDEA